MGVVIPFPEAQIVQLSEAIAAGVKRGVIEDFAVILFKEDGSTETCFTTGCLRDLERTLGAIRVLDSRLINYLNTQGERNGS